MLISVGIDHEHASLDFLERTTVLEHQWPKVLRTLISYRNVHEAVFLSTCLRTEVVAVIDRFHGAIEEITTTLADVTGVPTIEFEGVLSVHFDRGVASHLFAVAAGLKSVVPGEFEILGQLRRSLELATDEHTAGHELTELFQRAIASGRRVRAETAISRGTTSFAQAAVSMVTTELGSQLGGATAVVVGAGQLATGVVKGLLGANVREVLVFNRTAANAEELATRIDDPRVRVVPLDELAQHLRTARVVVVAVEVTTPIISRTQLEACVEPLLVVDLGAPRAVASNVDDLTCVHRVDIGDLRELVAAALGGRGEAAEEARHIVATDVERYLDDLRARGAAPLVSELREYFDQLAQSEMARHERDLAGLSDEQRDLVQSLVRSLVAKIAHRPTVALKAAAGTDQGIRLSEATRDLFDL